MIELFVNALPKKVFAKLVGAVQKRREEDAMHRFGGIQKCPWCRQWTQLCGDDWNFKMWDKDPMYDLLTCNCGGTSVWRFEMGMHFVYSLEPPKPEW